jgi:two-component system nitrate/nitrite sensor histidine kinase NarX
MAARQIVVALQDLQSAKAFVWTFNEPAGADKAALRFWQLGPLERRRYFFDAPDSSWHVALESPGEPGAKLDCLVVDREGRRLPEQFFSFREAFFSNESHSTVLAVDFAIPSEWSGRLFVLDRKTDFNPAADLALLQSMVWEAAPSIHSTYVLCRVRSRARADERLRVAHEIHDGLLQSLIGVEMQIEVLHRRSVQSSPELAGELEKLHRILHREIIQARAVMESLKIEEMSPKQMLAMASEMISDFERETGIAASFVCEREPIDLAPHVCRQLASILREGLTNVRKHSEARNVHVRLALEQNWWKLTIADDGQGCKFADEPARADIQTARMGPVVIRERAQSIGAEFDFESFPGRGSCVEVRLRQQESFG